MTVTSWSPHPSLLVPGLKDLVGDSAGGGGREGKHLLFLARPALYFWCWRKDRGLYHLGPTQRRMCLSCQQWSWRMSFTHASPKEKVLSHVHSCSDHSAGCRGTRGRCRRVSSRAGVAAATASRGGRGGHVPTARTLRATGLSGFC